MVAPALQFHHPVGLALWRSLRQRQAAGLRKDHVVVDRADRHRGPGLARDVDEPLGAEIGPGARGREVVVDGDAHGGAPVWSAACRSRSTRRMILPVAVIVRSEEHTSELQSLMRISYAVFCLKKKRQKN